MTTYLFIGLILLLAVYLLRARRARSAGGADTPAPPKRPSLRKPKAPVAASAPAPAPAPADAPRPDAPPPVAFGPRPLEPAMAWEPGETIVEPGWPLPGEIAGTWSPPLAPSGPSALPEATPEPMAVVEWAPAAAPSEDPEPAGAADPSADLPSAEEWVMPALEPAPSAPPLWVPGQDEFSAPAATAGDAAPAWIDPAPAEVAAAVEAPAPAEAPEMPELAWLSESAPAEEPAWLAGLDIPAAVEPEAAEPEAAEPEADAPDAPPTIAWLPAEPEAAAFEAAAPEAPAEERATVTETETEAEAEAEPVAEFAPVAEEPPAFAWAPEPSPAVEPLPEPAPAASLEDQSAEVAGLVAGLAEDLVPFARIPDRLGVTPRMLALMRALAEEPRTVTDQARALGASRPVVADLCSRLVVLGLATREPLPADRRRVLVTLTAAGRRTVADAGAAASPADVAGLIAGLPAAERDALVSGLRALRTAR